MDVSGCRSQVLSLSQKNYEIKGFKKKVKNGACILLDFVWFT